MIYIIALVVDSLVPRGGIEPPRDCSRQILSLVRLPISPPRQWGCTLLTNSGLSVGTDRLFHRETRQYHRRKGTLLLCSGWKQVLLPCQKHRHSSLSSCVWRFWIIRASERVSSGFNLVLSQVARPISTSQLHMLPCFHFRPIKQVIFLRPLGT